MHRHILCQFSHTCWHIKEDFLHMHISIFESLDHKLRLLLHMKQHVERCVAVSWAVALSGLIPHSEPLIKHVTNKLHHCWQNMGSLIKVTLLLSDTQYGNCISDRDYWESFHWEPTEAPAHAATTPQLWWVFSQVTYFRIKAPLTMWYQHYNYNLIAAFKVNVWFESVYCCNLLLLCFLL